jgi:DNA repair protein RecO (recombination protein O)
LRNRFGASLEPFTLIQLTYYAKENQELVSFRQTEILRSHFKLSSDTSILAGLAYIGDLLVEFSPPHQVNDTLYRMTSACLDAIATFPNELQTILRYFEVWLLKIEGFLPDLKRCAECHRTFVEESVYMGADLGLRCGNCRAGREAAMSKRLHAHLRTVERLSPVKFAERAGEINNQTKREMAELTHQLIGRVLERSPRVRPTFAL